MSERSERAIHTATIVVTAESGVGKGEDMSERGTRAVVAMPEASVSEVER
ncbi:hypothetical protein IU438_22805 [Nocardia cyriacigeorgica]|jgi:hypothetical protein|uniref:Uncharacterized protein n=1 Tax=Nocardia cyriacigeorgica TaxID=135487 RepID=A0A4U8VTY2_9NOCA|nr:hypothetical protein [Nocardia cyriacigeorgica]MBF6084095.1 hypothetical protein [Nocardia cyriacigeorgica]MBF6093387.1 hypothetical protein [Nocardia cyriacigeorgica]MBF6157546.1 hypothetical protein [Nocardia cyriacigeorgica]MBF6196517.1 hypothetical protein [Nocardia cyriacigeorgica]MBF6286565.1 hypothetical protein [Nocardia cyriacigeorgica]